jgi:hypothetical protein
MVRTQIYLTRDKHGFIVAEPECLGAWHDAADRKVGGEQHPTCGARGQVE